MSNNYTSKEIKTIDELIDHIIENVGMYIGESETPIHLFEECFTNSIDEAIANYCNIIAVKIEEDNSYHIVDNGRGIPIENDVPISISTKFSGAKFNRSKSAYNITCLHGDTKLFLLDRSGMTISEMANSQSKEFWGLSFTDKGEFVSNKLYAPQITGYTKEMIRVYLDNGDIEECTLDHLWMLRDGNYKQAKDLEKNDSIMPYYRNHKIVKTEIVNYDEEIPVYDIHSPNYNNFVLESGAVVHNSGKHGVGLVVVNALSLWYQIEIYRDGKYANYKFEDGKLTENNIEDYNGKAPFSTKVSFKPNPKFFDKESIKIDDIKSRALVASVEIPDCTLVVEENGNREVISHDKFEYFKEHCLNSDNEMSDIIHIKSSNKDEIFEALFCWSKDGPLSQKVLSSVNVLPVIDGGTHVNIFNEIVRDVLVEKGKKLNYRFQPLDVQVRLRCYISCYLRQPEFGAQSKDKVTNRKEYFDKLRSKFRKEFENYLNNNQNILESLLNQFQSYRRSLDSKKLRGNSNKRSSTKLTKLKDCRSRDGELFVVEGDSACFVGDQEILDINLNNIPFEHLYENINQNNYYTFSCDKYGRIYPSKITNCFITKRVRTLVKVTLDNDEEIKCTLDHRFMLRDGNYKQAKDLEENDSLMPFYYGKNIKIKFIELIDVNLEPVYDITVDAEDHNFPLSSGIFVHNSGTVSEVRNPNIHAILPLKGKVPSVITKKEEIIKNQEIGELITALGTGYGPEFDINKLRYDKVICLTDADPDGNHIASLLTIAIAVLVPDVIKQGKYYIARTPLRAINDRKKGEFTPLWTKEDYDKAIKDKRPVTYFKGLGELDGWQLEICALNPDNRRLIQVKYPNNVNEVMSLFSDVNKKRELLENDEIGLID